MPLVRRQRQLLLLLDSITFTVIVNVILVHRTSSTLFLSFKNYSWWSKIFCSWLIEAPFFFSANAAKELLVPYFPPIIESLKGFLTATAEEMRSLQTQSLGRLTNRCSSDFQISLWFIHIMTSLTYCFVVLRHTLCSGPYHWERCLQSTGCRVRSTGPQPHRHYRWPWFTTMHVCSYKLVLNAFLATSVSPANHHLPMGNWVWCPFSST